MKRRELIILGLFVSATWAYVALRACVVPFVQDEGNSFWFFAYTGEFLPFLSHPEAGNHFLSSFTGVLGYRWFGFSPLGVRLGSVLSFPLYAWACWCLVRPLSQLPRWCSLGALLWCPFLLDYFSMFRGYGPAMAGWAWALLCLLAFANSGRPRHFVLMVVASSLALFADLSLLPTCLILLFLCVLLITSRTKDYGPAARFKLAVALMAHLVLIMFAASIALDLREQDLLYLGPGDSFVRVTVRTLANAVFSTPVPVAILWSLVCLVLLAIGMAIWSGVMRKNWRTPLVLLAGVMAMEVAGRVVMKLLLGTNFPEDRAALHLLPLFILLLAYLVHTLEQRHRNWA